MTLSFCGVIHITLSFCGVTYSALAFCGGTHPTLALYGVTHPARFNIQYSNVFILTSMYTYRDICQGDSH